MGDEPKLLVVVPAWSQGWWGDGKVPAPSLTLPLLAGLTLPDAEARLVDENVEIVDTNAPVGWYTITRRTAPAPRGYATAGAL